MSKYLILVLFFTFLGIAYFFSKSASKQSDNPIPTPIPSQEASIDYKASFAIFTNGTFRIFTASMYHNRSEDVFIQADNPNIVHVKKAGITWNDFFKTLPFALTKACLTTGTKETFCTNENEVLKFYLNGKRNDNALDQVIQKGDRLIVMYGNETETQIENQIQKIPTP